MSNSARFQCQNAWREATREVACARLQGQTCPQGLYMPTTALEHKRRPDLGQSALAALPAYLGQAPEPNVFVENAKTPGPAAA